MSKLEILAPAKVNLYLGVSPEKTENGYHTLKTVYHLLDFGDIVTIEPAETLSCTTSVDLGIPQEDNLAYKAAVLMGKAYDKAPAVAIHIEKNIPAQAGLAGGSADAAAVIKGLAKLWGAENDVTTQLAIASQLGADVSAFLYDGPTLMGNFGEELIERFSPLNAPVLLVKPQAGVNTAEAYARFDRRPDHAMPIELMLIGMREGDIEVVGSHVSNNLELAAIELVPEISHVQAFINAQPGAYVSHVSGSGSTVFAVFDTHKEAEEAQKAAEKKGWWAQKTQLSTSGIKFMD